MKNPWVQRLIAVFLFAGFWTAAAGLGGLPHLGEILRAAVTLIRQGFYFHDIAISLSRFAVGWICGGALGISIGLVTGRLERFSFALEQNIQILRPIPVIALVPLSVYWWGIGELSKYFIVAWGSFFPVWLNTHTAAARVNQAYLNAAASLGADGRFIWIHVVLPSVSQALLTGLRISIGVGLICVVAGELTGAYEQGFFSQGLGYRIQRAADTNRMATMIACIFTFGIIGWFLDKTFSRYSRPLVQRIFGFDPGRSHAGDKHDA